MKDIRDFTIKKSPDGHYHLFQEGEWFAKEGTAGHDAFREVLRLCSKDNPAMLYTLELFDKTVPAPGDSAQSVARSVVRYALNQGLVPQGVTCTKKAFKVTRKHICSQKTF